jgi:hypothetical protein
MTPQQELEACPLLPEKGPLDLEVAIRMGGSLGLHVDSRESDQAIVIRGVSPDGVLARSLPPGLRPTRLIGATWAGLNGRSILGLPIIRVVPLIKRLPRPMTLHLTLLGILASPSDAAPGHELLSPSSAPPRTLQTQTVVFTEASLGIRFKSHASLPSCLYVASLSRGEGDRVLPAEAAGVQEGRLLLAVNNQGLRDKPPADVAVLLRNPARPIRFTFCEDPDVVVELQGREPLDLDVAPFERDVVVTGLIPRKGPVEECGRCRPGDVLIGINGVTLPSPRGYAADMDLLRNCTYPARLVFARPTWPGTEANTFEVVLPENRGKWGVLLVRGRDDRPVIKVRRRMMTMLSARCAQLPESLWNT